MTRFPSGALALAALAALSTVGEMAAQQPGGGPIPQQPLAGALPQQPGVGVFPPLVAERCTGCHDVPRPETIPRYHWSQVIETMEAIMDFHEIEISKAELAEIEAFYLASSPPELPQIPDNYADCNLGLRKLSVGQIRLEARPQITGVVYTDISGDGLENDIIVTDNNAGAVSWLRLEEGGFRETVLARMPAPVKVTPLDFNGNGRTDLAVSAMGIMHPNEDLIGELHLLINRGDGTFDQHVILDGVARITDCTPGDFTGDGRIDFIVAMFGWRETGGIGLLKQVEDETFEFETVMDINGPMQVFTNDANGNGVPDFLVLISQQHEAIVQFVNQGGGQFSNHIVTRSRNPSFGSSSMHVADLNGNGHEDILFTNGDMMDESPVPKPHHGVRWLENDGEGNYTLHYLAGMPGCYHAVPYDMTGNGELDIVFSSLNFTWNERDFPSLAWLENQGGFRQFVPRRIDYAPTNLIRIAVGDVNGNGRPDIIAGGMHVPGPIDRAGRLTIWMSPDP